MCDENVPTGSPGRTINTLQALPPALGVLGKVLNGNTPAVHAIAGKVLKRISSPGKLKDIWTSDKPCIALFSVSVNDATYVVHWARWKLAVVGLVTLDRNIVEPASV